jgi:predicted site-specific integrase-resolvase
MDRGAEMPYKKLPHVTPDFIRVVEAAARLGVDPKTVRNRLASGALPVRVLRLDGITRLHRKDFERYLEREPRMLTNSA